MIIQNSRTLKQLVLYLKPDLQLNAYGPMDDHVPNGCDDQAMRKSKRKINLKFKMCDSDFYYEDPYVLSKN